MNVHQKMAKNPTEIALLLLAAAQKADAANLEVKTLAWEMLEHGMGNNDQPAAVGGDAAVPIQPVRALRAPSAPQYTETASTGEAEPAPKTRRVEPSRQGATFRVDFQEREGHTWAQNYRVTSAD